MSQGHFSFVINRRLFLVGVKYTCNLGYVTCQELRGCFLLVVFTSVLFKKVQDRFNVYSFEALL